MYCDLFSILKDNVLLLTANQRLTEYLFRDFNRLQQEKNIKTWRTPNILPLNAWMSKKWQSTKETQGLLLDDLEENILWQTIIVEDEETNAVLALNQAVQLIKSAWHTLQLWQIKLSDLNPNSNNEVAKFISLAKQFEEIKKFNQLYTHAELPTLIHNLIESGLISLPEKIIFYGFDQLSPAIDSLVNLIKTKTKFIFFEFLPQHQSVSKTTCINEDQEILAMAQWSKEKLVSITAREKIGCVIPKLNKKRDKILRIFTQVFAPENIIPGQTQKQIPFNISVGVPLHHYPMINTALNILSMSNDIVHQNVLKNILLSSYVNSIDDNRNLAAMAEYALAQADPSKLDLAFILTTITQLSKEHYPKTNLAQRFEQYMKYTIPTNKKLMSHWSEFFQKRLQLIGWPGQKPLASQEFQVMQRWQNILNDAAKLDRILPPIHYSRALHILHECTKALFQPQSKDKPIQILGTLEAIGCRFKALWLMGLDDETWPDKASPNPFLPIDLQRKLNMPHASAERELEFSKRTQNYLIHSSSEVILSYSEQEEDKIYHPSRLISSFNEVIITLKPINDPPQDITLECINDYQAPAINTEESISGGSFILREQSLCPFKAFAQMRLLAKPMEKAQIGLSAKVRGELTHLALDLIWKKIKSQQLLLSYPQSQLQIIIEECVDKTIITLDNKIQHYREVERKRLIRILEKWLEIEKKRPSFTVVARETKYFIKIGSLSLRIQIDRIDELEDGNHLIIDYKTGKDNSISNWLGERPREPQLPIYFLYGSEKNIGLSYAEINFSSLTFKGLINSEQTFSKIQNTDKKFKRSLTWEMLMMHWQQAILNLSNEFTQGVATVTPQDNTICNHCHLTGLCRIGEKK